MDLEVCIHAQRSDEESTHTESCTLAIFPPSYSGCRVWLPVYRLNRLFSNSVDMSKRLTQQQKKKNRIED